MQKTYLFYDVETTGRNPCFDQILQFAAIRTDLELNELERHHVRIKLNCDVIPDPEALLVHRIPMSQMLQGEPEVEAIAKIHAWLNTPGTISGGYNTLGFDDEFMRFSFYRNLLPPYSHQWANQCGRFDLYPLAQLYFLYHPECLQWPTNPEGKISLKLEYLNAANQLAAGNAHDAMVDVEATLALARKFFALRKMWDYAMEYFDKNADLKRRHQLTNAFDTQHGAHPLALLIGKSGSGDFFQYPVLFLGQHFHYKNQTLWLRLDMAELTATTQENIANTWVARKKPGETGFLLPFSPRFTQHLTAERQQRVTENLDWLSHNLRLFEDIRQYHCDYKYPVIANVDVDADLYNTGFLTPQEERLCAKFHAVPPDKKVAVIEQFHNPHLHDMPLRIMGRHYPHYLTPPMARKFADYLHTLNDADNPANIPIDYRGKRRLIRQVALADIESLRASASADAEKLHLLQELENYTRRT